MTQRVRNAFGRFLTLASTVAIVMTFAARPAAAQATAGKIEGTVTNQAGEPIAKAQVIVVGTAFGAVTDDKGYYFINNVPVGTYTLRAQFIGYTPSELTGARVFGGQTMTFNFKMSQAAVTLGAVNVVAAANPIVPRDQVQSKTIVSGQQFNQLPVDNTRAVIALQPGVVESGSGKGVSIRGGRPGEANVYIDGVPVRSTISGTQSIDIGTNAVEEASVTTGALNVQFGDAQSGVITYNTRSGGESLKGSLSYQTDEPFGNAVSVGQNRIEASVGGPIPAVSNLRFFLSGVAQGQSSFERGTGWENVPTYVMAGIDTVVTTQTTNGLQQVVIPAFAQYSGTCTGSTPAAGAGYQTQIADNYGFDCQGRRLAYDWSTNTQLQGKLTYSYGQGSSVSLSGIATGAQSRGYPGTSIGDPAAYGGNHNWNRLGVLNWTHSVFKESDRELSFTGKLSIATDKGISGPLTAASEQSTRDPTGGFEFSSLDFNFPGGFMDQWFNDPDRIIRNIRNNQGLRVPLLNRTDLRNVQPFRMNPYGMISGSWITNGFDVGGTLSSEKRYYGTIQADWQANRYHRFNFGGDLQLSDVALWSSSFRSQIFMDAYHAKPTTGAIWGSDRLDLGDVVIDLGLRYDYFHCNCDYSKTPGFIFGADNSTVSSTFPWNPAGYTNDTAYTNSVKRTFRPGQVHTTLSPRIAVSFPITEQTDFRLSYSHQVQSPDFNTLLSGTNNDLSFTNTNDAFGRDVGFSKTVLFEFGVRHAFNPDLVLDVSAYNKAKTSDLAYRIKPFNNPAVPGQVVNINVLTTADFGYDRGIDMKLDRRIGDWLQASVAYTFETARGTGSDPFSYLNTSARQISNITNTPEPPAEQAAPTDDQRTHNIAGSVSFTVPQGWQQGTTVGKVFQDVSAFVTFRALSGLPYTPLINLGNGNLRGGFGLVANQLGPTNSATLPWTKNIDLRLNKGFHFGRFDLTAFAYVTNLFNFKNVVNIFTETNDIVNAFYQSKLLAPEFAQISQEARTQNALLADGSVDLRGSCAAWNSAEPDAGVVNCVMLQRTEARFGNGDGIYTPAEQSKALNAYYQFVRGTQVFYGAPRHIRIGFELNF